MGYRKQFGFLSSFCSSFALMSYVTGITGGSIIVYLDILHRSAQLHPRFIMLFFLTCNLYQLPLHGNA